MRSSITPFNTPPPHPPVSSSSPAPPPPPLSSPSLAAVEWASWGFAPTSPNCVPFFFVCVWHWHVSWLIRHLLLQIFDPPPFGFGLALALIVLAGECIVAGCVVRSIGIIFPWSVKWAAFWGLYAWFVDWLCRTWGWFLDCSFLTMPTPTTIVLAWWLYRLFLIFFRCKFFFGSLFWIILVLFVICASRSGFSKCFWAI